MMKIEKICTFNVDGLCSLHNLNLKPLRVNLHIIQIYQLEILMKLKKKPLFKIISQWEKLNKTEIEKYVIMNTTDPIELLVVDARLVSKQHTETFKLFSEEHLNHINSGIAEKSSIIVKDFGLKFK